MKKNKIIAVVLSALLLIPSVAYAKGPKDKGNGGGTTVETGANKGNGKGEDKKAENEKKKADQEAFKKQMREKHEIMKANTKKSVELRKEIGAMNEELSPILLDIVAGKKTLTEEQLAALTAQAEIVKADAAVVNEFKFISNDVKDTQEKVKGQKFDTALAAMDRVIAKQEARIKGLEKLKEDLKVLLDIAKQAQVVAAPGDDTQPANPATPTDPTTPTQPADPAPTTPVEPAPTTPTQP